MKPPGWCEPVSEEEPPPIGAPYLICLNVPCYRDQQGRRFFDPLWHKDLTQHLRYLHNLTLACPCETGEPPPGAIEGVWSQPRIQFVDLAASHNIVEAILHLPSTAARLWRAIGRADIVHSGVAGWPIPAGWLASLLAAIRGKISVIVVESAPWRLRPGLPATFRKKLRASLSETLARWCVRRAQLFIATQREYLATLPARDSNAGHVIHASWLDDDAILSPEAAAESWRSKSLSPGATLKLVFAGRLDRSKGILTLLEAMRQSSRERIPVELNILGQGELLHECEQAARDLRGAARIRTAGVLPYGPAFFGVLREHHAMVVPSLSDEQPRVVYDAFSQAVPVLASDTPGLLECVQHERTGLIAPAGRPACWARRFRWCLDHPDRLEAMGTAGLEVARGLTHQEMHRRRWRLLAALIKRPRNGATTR